MFAVHDPDGRVVASGENGGFISRLFGCAPGMGPAWLREVADALLRGEACVMRQDRVGSGRMVSSQHRLLTTAEGGMMIGSHYVLAPECQRRSERQWSAERHWQEATSGERLADVLQLSSDWLFETDATLALTYISERASDDLGVGPTGLIGRRLTEIGVFDDGPECFRAAADGDWRPFVDRMAEVSVAGSRVRRVRFSGLPMLADGTFVGYRGVARDETRQQSAREAVARAEERLRLGLTACRDGLAIFEADGQLAYANQQIAADLGRGEMLPPGTALGTLLAHALRSGWFVDCDAPSLATAETRLGDPADGHSMVEIGIADGRTVLFCANRAEGGDIILMSTDVTGVGASAAARTVRRPEPLRSTA